MTRNGKPQHPSVAVVRCAIHTRKSTEEGLEQEFNSLDAQREAGEAYIASQRAEGWHCLLDRYDDGGFTDGNTDRPALQRLLADIEAGRVDCIVGILRTAIPNLNQRDLQLALHWIALDHPREFVCAGAESSCAEVEDVPLHGVVISEKVARVSGALKWHLRSRTVQVHPGQTQCSDGEARGRQIVSECIEQLNLDWDDPASIERATEVGQQPDLVDDGNRRRGRHVSVVVAASESRSDCVVARIDWGGGNDHDVVVVVDVGVAERWVAEAFAVDSVD